LKNQAETSTKKGFENTLKIKNLRKKVEIKKTNKKTIF